jgi:uncharacterized membrane protein
MTLQDTRHHEGHHRPQSAAYSWILRFLLFALLGVIGYYVIVEHGAHLLQFLPLLILLACPLMHLLHGGHGGHRHTDRSNGEAGRTP